MFLQFGTLIRKRQLERHFVNTRIRITLEWISLWKVVKGCWKKSLIRIIKLFLIFITSLETDKTPHEVAFGVFFNLLKSPHLTDLHYLRLLSRLSTNRLNYKLFVFLILSFVFYSCVANIYVHIIKQHFIDFLFRRVDNVIYSVLYLLSFWYTILSCTSPDGGNGIGMTME